jgi:hypothetical protein
VCSRGDSHYPTRSKRCGLASRLLLVSPPLGAPPTARTHTRSGMPYDLQCLSEADDAAAATDSTQHLGGAK